MIEGLPAQSSRHADEGSAAHALAALCLTIERSSASPYLGQHLAQVDGFWVLLDRPRESGDSYEVTDEMIEAVDMYLEVVLSKNGSVFVEQRVDLGDGLFGTPDAIVATVETLHVIDFKYGAGVPVEVQGNGQLRFYAAAALGKIRDVFRQVELTIVQPRARHADGPVRSETLSPLELDVWEHSVLWPAVEAARQPDAPLKAGDHCRFCPALGICSAALELQLEVIGRDFRVIDLPDPGTLATGDLVRVQDGSALLLAWLKAVAAELQNRLVAGEEVPGYKLVTKRANRAWRDEALVREYLGMYVDVEETRLLSPAQVEKALRAGGYGKVDLGPYTVRADAGVVMAPASDRRPDVHAEIENEFREPMKGFEL